MDSSLTLLNPPYDLRNGKEKFAGMICKSGCESKPAFLAITKLLISRPTNDINSEIYLSMSPDCLSSSDRNPLQVIPVLL